MAPPLRARPCHHRPCQRYLLCLCPTLSPQFTCIPPLAGPLPPPPPPPPRSAACCKAKIKGRTDKTITPELYDSDFGLCCKCK